MNKAYVYILANKINSVFYIGVTNDLVRRVYEHQQKLIVGFTSRYNISRLVHYEEFPDIRSAIEREKKLKGLVRSKKIELIRSTNPEFRDLASRIA